MPPIESNPTPETLPLTVTIRDFTPEHPDFEMDPVQSGTGTGTGYGIVTGIVKPTLVNRKPTYAGNPKTAWTSGADNFNLWFSDNSGFSKDIVLTLRKKPGTQKTYQFDSDIDQPYKDRGGFFPIDSELRGNYKDTGHNFHFTLEMHSDFTYAGDEEFTFRGDDDLWVFINNKLVIDLGGVHKKENGGVVLAQRAAELGLEVGKTYPFDLFYAERHTTQSNLKIETSIALKPVILPIASIEATQPNAKKTGPVAGGFTVKLNSPAPKNGLTVLFDLNDPATASGSIPLAIEGTDFILNPSGKNPPPAPRSLLIPEGQDRGTIQVTPQGPAPVGSSASLVVINLKPAPTYQLAQPSAAVTIADRQPWNASLSPVTDAIKVGVRNSHNGQFQVQLDNPAPAGGVTVNYSIAAGTTADPDRDYFALPGMVVVAAGSKAATIPVVPKGTANRSEQKPLVLQLVPGIDYHPNPAPATIQIIDEAAPLPPVVIPTVGIAGTGPAVRNPRQEGSFTISCFDKRPDQRLTVTYQLSGAAMGREYQSIAGVTPGATPGTWVGTAILLENQTSVKISVIPTTAFGSLDTVKVIATLQPNPSVYKLGSNPASVDILAQGPTPDGGFRRR
jgi:fibro-slime domain-containing protein